MAERIPETAIARLSALALEDASLGGFVYDGASGRAWFSAGQRTLTGLGPLMDEHGEIEASAFFERIHADDLPSVQHALDHASANGVPYLADFRFQRLEDTEIWLEGRGEYIQVPDRDEPLLIGVNLDISRRKRAERRNALLVSEMSHRIGNMLAAIHALLRASREDGDTLALQRLEGRVQAMGLVSTLGIGLRSGGLYLDTLAREVLAPYLGTKQVATHLPHAPIGDEVAQVVSLVLNELASRSVTDGALASYFGEVELSPCTDPRPGGGSSGKATNGDSHIGFTWLERAGGGPRDLGKLSPFARRTLFAMVEGTGGRAALNTAEDGFRYSASWPSESFTIGGTSAFSETAD